MKRILSLIIVVILLFSVCSCDSKPQNDEIATPVIEIEPQPEPEPEPEPEPKPQPEPEPEPEPVNTDKGDACTLTLDNTFSPYEVIITLTLEESAKGLTYTPEDFPEIDCYYVFDVDSRTRNTFGYDDILYLRHYKYYNIEMYPECEHRTTLSLLLNKPSKEGVLEAVKKLEQDNRVYMAEPSCDIIAPVIHINVKDKSHTDLTIEDFPECKIKAINTYNTSCDLTLVTKYKDGDITDYTRYKPIYNNIKTLLKDNRVESISLIYLHTHLELYNIDIEASRFYPSIKADDFTEEDFPYLNISHMRVDRTKDKFIDMNTIDKVYLTLSETSRQNFFDSIALLENDPRVTSIELHYYSYGTVIND